MNKWLHMIGISVILLMLIIRPYPAVAAPKNVDDWLKENSDHTDGDTSGNEGNKQKNEEDRPALTEDNDTKTEANSGGSLFVVFVKMIFALLLVLGLIYVLLQFLRRKNKLFRKNNALQNIGGITVGTNKSMQIVRIGSRFFVIGVGENVEILHEITDQEVLKGLSEQEESVQNSANRFVASLASKAPNGQNGERNFKQLFSRELLNLKQSRKKILNENKEDTHE